MTIKTPTEMADEAAASLIGTCQSIASLGEEYKTLEMNGEFCARLDEQVFECTQCGWWCGQEEMADNDDWVCQECAEST